MTEEHPTDLRIAPSASGCELRIGLESTSDGYALSFDAGVELPDGAIGEATCTFRQDDDSEEDLIRVLRVTVCAQWVGARLVRFEEPPLPGTYAVRLSFPTARLPRGLARDDAAPRRFIHEARLRIEPAPAPAGGDEVDGRLQEIVSELDFLRRRLVSASHEMESASTTPEREAWELECVLLCDAAMIAWGRMGNVRIAA